jgi:hypothetical protein
MITNTTIPAITPEELKALWPDHPAHKTDHTEDSLSFTTMYDPKPWPFPEAVNYDWNSMLNTTPQDSTLQVLDERAKNYGKFSGIGQLTQTFKEIMRQAPSWETMQPDQKESLEMIVHKLARILNGNPDYADSWVDIAGYARLVSERLETGLER